MADALVGSGGRLWSVIFYRCDCGEQKARLFEGSVQIEDLS